MMRSFANHDSSLRALLALVALTLVTLGGCSSQPVQRADEVAASETIINLPRGNRGNPAVYEVFGQRYFVLETSVGYREQIGRAHV